MRIIEIGTGYTSIPARMGAATEIVVEELTKSMIKNGERVSLVDIKDPRRLPNKLPIVEVNVPKRFSTTDVQLGILHKLKRVVYSISLASVLKKILKSENENVILHFHNQYNLYFFLLLVSKKLRKKAVIAYTNHSYIWQGDWEDIKETVKKRYFQEIECFKKSDVLFVLNNKTKNVLEKNIKIDSNKMRLIDNGVNTDIYNPLSENEIVDFMKCNSWQNKKMIFQVGSVCDRKNQLESVKMLTPILKSHKELFFAYTGGIIDSDYQGTIMQYARENGIIDQVVYVGELQPGKVLNQYYSTAVATIFPSKMEAFGMAIIESMSAGTPCFINNKSIFETLDGCIRFDSEDEFRTLFECEILNEEKRTYHAKKAREKAVECYSWDKVATDYVAGFKSNVIIVKQSSYSNVQLLK